jgi:bisanhydrobacterioruberin hydratase
MISFHVFVKHQSKIIALLILLHLVGLIGLLSTYTSLFLALTPINLLLSIALVIACNGFISTQLKSWLLITFFIGYGIEVIGVKTGLIFGDYFYTEVLGYAVFGVPVLLGFNWIMVSFGSYSLVNNLKITTTFKVILAALLCVLLDIFIEPVAIFFNYWVWSGGSPPIQNYLAWFAVAAVLQGLAQYLFQGNIKSNKVAAALFLIQFAFFLLLSFYIYIIA